ncbi:MAG: AAA family ATPase [Bacteroidota bacterium]|nr:AAA family ATPase [Bacteroidota bacterium]
MRTTLIFDYDKSLAAIGDDKKLTELFGLPPVRISNGLDETIDYIKKLVKKVKTKTTHPIFDNMVETEAYELNPKAKELNLNTIIFDTISAMGLQERQVMKSKKKQDTLDLRGWGLYGDAVNSFIFKMCSMPYTIIMTSHIDHDKDGEGQMLDYPALKGSAKNEIQKWFDVILYTRINKDKDKITTYLWQTKPDERRLAKDRLGVLPEFMEQDFNLLLGKYAERGIHNPKILILGESGTGKTRSFETINKINTNGKKEN